MATLGPAHARARCSVQATQHPRTPCSTAPSSPRPPPAHSARPHLARHRGAARVDARARQLVAEAPGVAADVVDHDGVQRPRVRGGAVGAAHDVDEVVQHSVGETVPVRRSHTSAGCGSVHKVETPLMRSLACSYPGQVAGLQGCLPRRRIATWFGEPPYCARRLLPSALCYSPFPPLQ